MIGEVLESSLVTDLRTSSDRLSMTAATSGRGPTNWPSTKHQAPPNAISTTSEPSDRRERERESSIATTPQ